MRKAGYNYTNDPSEIPEGADVEEAPRSEEYDYRYTTSGDSGGSSEEEAGEGGTGGESGGGENSEPVDVDVDADDVDFDGRGDYDTFAGDEMEDIILDTVATVDAEDVIPSDVEEPNPSDVAHEMIDEAFGVDEAMDRVEEMAVEGDDDPEQVFDDGMEALADAIEDAVYEGDESEGTDGSGFEGTNPDAIDDPEGYSDFFMEAIEDDELGEFIEDQEDAESFAYDYIVAGEDTPIEFPTDANEVVEPNMDEMGGPQAPEALSEVEDSVMEVEESLEEHGGEVAEAMGLSPEVFGNVIEEGVETMIDDVESQIEDDLDSDVREDFIEGAKERAEEVAGGDSSGGESESSDESSGESESQDEGGGGEEVEEADPEELWNSPLIDFENLSDEELEAYEEFLWDMHEEGDDEQMRDAMDELMSIDQEQMRREAEEGDDDGGQEEHRPGSGRFEPGDQVTLDTERDGEVEGEVVEHNPEYDELIIETPDGVEMLIPEDEIQGSPDVSTGDSEQGGS